MKFYPSILTDSPEFFQEELNRIAALEPKPEVVQIDILDGEFADNITVEAGFIRQAHNPGVRYDMHLMTQEPAQVLEEFWGEQSVRAVIGQIERMHDINQFIADVQEGGWIAGLSLDIFTPISALEEVQLETVGMVQIMGNQAGRQGQELHSSAIEKIKELATLRADLGLQFEIVVDIGVNQDTVAEITAAGADAGVVGSAIQGEQGRVHWKTLHGLKG